MLTLMSALCSASYAQSPEDIGVCSGAVAVEFQKGDRNTATRYYNEMKSQIDKHDTRIAKACPGGKVTESCFNTLPLDTRKYMNARHSAIKDLNSPNQTNLLNKPGKGNDPMTRGVVLMGFCSK
jgi:hypothetical protein